MEAKATVGHAPPGSASTLTRNMVILACAVDAADKALLPATFKALDEQFHLGPSRLAALAFAQSITFSFALPVWGSLMRYHSAKDLMVCGCVLWAVTTLALAAATMYEVQFVLRLMVGAALASVNPLGQAMLCDIVPEEERGKAFGILQSTSSALAMTVSFFTTWIASKDFGGIRGWRIAHVLIACLSLQVAMALRVLVVGTPPSRLHSGTTWFDEQRRVLRDVGAKPSFFIMVAQGVTGGIPWNAFAFLTFYFQLSGYTDFEAAQIVLLGGIGGVLGGILGGTLGDFASGRLCGTTGRVAVAQTSVVLGTATFLWMIFVPYGATSFPVVTFACFLFNAVSSWTPAAALRPICGEIFANSHDRAQVLALWIALEGVISSVFGAPLCGRLSEAFGYRLTGGSGATPATELERIQSRDALRAALIGVSIIPWLFCAVAWVPMYWTYPHDRDKAKLDDAAHADDTRPTATTIGSAHMGAGYRPVGTTETP